MFYLQLHIFMKEEDAGGFIECSLMAKCRSYVRKNYEFKFYQEFLTYNSPL